MVYRALKKLNMAQITQKIKGLCPIMAFFKN